MLYFRNKAKYITFQCCFFFVA